MFFADVAADRGRAARSTSTEAVQARARDARAHARSASTWNKAVDRRGDQGDAARHGLKMPQLAHAVRVLVCGRAQTPSLDAVLALFARETVLARLREACEAWL